MAVAQIVHRGRGQYTPNGGTVAPGEIYGGGQSVKGFNRVLTQPEDKPKSSMPFDPGIAAGGDIIPDGHGGTVRKPMNAPYTPATDYAAAGYAGGDILPNGQRVPMNLPGPTTAAKEAPAGKAANAAVSTLGGGAAPIDPKGPLGPKLLPQGGRKLDDGTIETPAMAQQRILGKTPMASIAAPAAVAAAPVAAPLASVPVGSPLVRGSARILDGLPAAPDFSKVGALPAPTGLATTPEAAAAAASGLADRTGASLGGRVAAADPAYVRDPNAAEAAGASVRRGFDAVSDFTGGMLYKGASAVGSALSSVAGAGVSAGATGGAVDPEARRAEALASTVRTVAPVVASAATDFASGLGRSTPAGVSNSQAAGFEQPTQANPVPKTPTSPEMNIDEEKKKGSLFAGF